jgi:hypothetical protein
MAVGVSCSHAHRCARMRIALLDRVLAAAGACAARLARASAAALALHRKTEKSLIFFLGFSFWVRCTPGTPGGGIGGEIVGARFPGGVPRSDKYHKPKRADRRYVTTGT